MSIYKGSSKIGKVYKGSTKIGKVYKGNTLIYQSEPSLPLYAFTQNGQTYNAYLIGLYSTSGLFASLPLPATLKEITGTLGSSGSKVKIEVVEGQPIQNTYYKTVTLNNVKVYVYGTTSSSSIFVLEKSVIGSYVLQSIMQPTNKTNPSSVTSTKLIWEGTTYNRNSSGDRTWRPSAIS